MLLNTTIKKYTWKIVIYLKDPFKYIHTTSMLSIMFTILSSSFLSRLNQKHVFLRINEIEHKKIQNNSNSIRYQWAWI